MEKNYFISLTDQEISQIEGGTWLSHAYGFVYEAVRVYGGQVLDWIGQNSAGNETLMNCI